MGDGFVERSQSAASLASPSLPTRAIPATMLVAGSATMMVDKDVRKWRKIKELVRAGKLDQDALVRSPLTCEARS